MADEEVQYSDLTVADLKAEIDARNEDRDDEDKISKDGNKGDLVAALELDDEVYGDEDDDEDDEEDEDLVIGKPTAAGNGGSGDGAGVGDGSGVDGPQKAREVMGLPADQNPAESGSAADTGHGTQQGRGPTDKVDPTLEKVDQSHKAAAPTDGIVLKHDEAEWFEGEDRGTYVEVTKNVYREFYFRNTLRPSYSMVYVKGQMVPKTALQYSKAKVESPQTDAPVEQQDSDETVKSDA